MAKIGLEPLLSYQSPPDVQSLPSYGYIVVIARDLAVSQLETDLVGAQRNFSESVMLYLSAFPAAAATTLPHSVTTTDSSIPYVGDFDVSHLARYIDICGDGVTS